MTHKMFYSNLKLHTESRCACGLCAPFAFHSFTPIISWRALQAHAVAKKRCARFRKWSTHSDWCGLSESCGLIYVRFKCDPGWPNIQISMITNSYSYFFFCPGIGRLFTERDDWKNHLISWKLNWTNPTVHMPFQPYFVSSLLQLVW